MKKYIYAFIVLFFLTSCSSQKCDEVKINMDKNFVSYETKIPVKQGVVVLEMAEESTFSVDTPTSYVYAKPWGDVIYITITTPNGKERKLSGKICRTDYIPYDGYITIKTKSNPRYFYTWTDDVWTGLGEYRASFQESPISLKIRNVQNCKKNIPFLEDLPTEKKKNAKTDGNSSLSVPFFLEPGLEVLKKAISPAGDNCSKHQIFGGPLPEEEQEKIKKDFEDAVKLLKSTIGFKGEKNE